MNNLEKTVKKIEKSTKRICTLTVIIAILYLTIAGILLVWIIGTADEGSQQTGEDIGLIAPTAITEPVPVPEEMEEMSEVSLGTFRISHYCPCAKCCSKNDRITASGTVATKGRTIAVDPEVIKIGSKVIIGDQEYIAEDKGSAIKGQKIDIFVDDHQEALALGVKTAEVFIKR